MKSVLLIVSILLTFNLWSQEKETYNNPVIRGDMPDPSVIRIGGKYYATGTSSEWAPFYPVFESKDLVNWTQIGHIFNKKPEWTVNSFWAPELYHHKNGKIYCYYTARRKSDNVSYIGVAVADTPTSEYVDHGLIIEHGTEAIDAFVYDDDGQLYITWKAYGLDKRPIEIVGSKLSADGLRLEGETFSLLKDDEGIGMEGQYHFKHGDYYYIVYASRSCCGPGSDYDVCVARSKSFKGPYMKYEGNPILHGGGGEFISSGHGTAVVTPDGRMFYMCHAYLGGDDFYMGRQPILQEMYVGDDQWVHFRTGNITKIKQEVPFDGVKQNMISDFEDYFDDEQLQLNWTWNYVYSDVKTKIDAGKLLLSGECKAGNDFGSALCVRPAMPNYTYETQMANMNESFKGLTMYGDDKNLVMWGCEGDKFILKAVRDGKEELLYESAQSSDCFLRIEVQNGCKLNFYKSSDGQNWIKINDEAKDFSYLVRWDRIARPGLIHNGIPENPAEFSYFKLKNVN